MDPKIKFAFPHYTVYVNKNVIYFSVAIGGFIKIEIFSRQIFLFWLASNFVWARDLKNSRNYDSGLNYRWALIIIYSMGFKI